MHGWLLLWNHLKADNDNCLVIPVKWLKADDDNWLVIPVKSLNHYD